MTEINLLPIELSGSRDAVRFAKTLRQIIMIAFGIFLIFTLLGVIFIVFISIQISSTQNNQNSLKQKVEALSGTEQKIFLIKDRIGKIKFIYNAKNSGDKFQTLDKLLSSLPTNVTVNSVEINSAKTSFSVVSKDSIGMATFINSLVTNGIYKNITLTGFIFTPDRGYLISLESS